MKNPVSIFSNKSQNFKGFHEDQNFYNSFFGTVHIPDKTWLQNEYPDKPGSFNKIRGYSKVSPGNVKTTYNPVLEIGTIGEDDSWIIPKGWMIHEKIIEHFSEKGLFLSLCLVKNHAIPFIEHGGDQQISRKRICQILNYICSFLQVGGNIELANRYYDFTRGFPLKYLPFTIDPQYLRYWVYIPTKENIQNAITKFQKVLTDIAGIDFIRFFAVVEMAQKLFAATDLYELTQNARVNFQKELTDKFSSLERKLSYVYQDLPGPQDCLHFDCAIIG